MISVRGVSKYFGRFCAVDRVSFEVAPGDIVGFLGENGAGKTTLMRMLTTYFSPDAGRIHIDGEDITRDPLSARRKVGYLPETPPLYPDMTVREYLSFAAQLKEVPRRGQTCAVDHVLEECELTRVARQGIGTLSKGYKQRVGIAQALINHPAILILDEPTNGLDPVQILNVRRIIKNIGSHRTVIVSTHILSEIEQIVSRVVIMRNGAICADKPLAELLTGTSAQPRRSLEEVFLSLVLPSGNEEGCHE